MSSWDSRRTASVGAAFAAVIAVAALAAGCSGSGSAGSSGSGPTTVTVAYMGGPHDAGLLAVGQQQGYWKKVGINIQADSFTSGPTEIQAMASGNIDIAYLGPGAAWEPASGNATIITLDSINIGDYVIAQPGINSLADLKGKTVGYTKGTSGEMILREALAKAGLTMSDIKPVQLASTAVAPAFIAKHIDAAAIWAPISAKIHDDVPAAKFLASDADFTSQLKATQMWVASRSFLKQHPGTVQKFLEGWILANDYRVSHASATVNDSYSFMDGSTSKPDLASQYDTTTWLTSKQLLADYENGTADSWLTGLEGKLAQMGLQHGTVPPASFTDWSLYEKAAKALSL